MQTVNIQAIEAHLEHPSGKNKLTFQLFNKEFISKKYNLVILLNSCRQKEEIVLATHGSSFYEVYLNKGCITEKQSVLRLFAELISTSDDKDRSNTFSISELTNFNRSKKITLFAAQEYKVSLPYVWLFEYDDTSNEIKKTILRTYDFKIAAKNLEQGAFKTKTFANMSLSSSDSNIESEWKIRKPSFESTFLNINNLDIEAEPEENGKSWKLNYNAYTYYDYTSRKVVVDAIKSDEGIQLPLFEPPGQMKTNFALSFDFLYKLNYSVNIIQEISMQYFSNACNKNSIYCVVLEEVEDLSIIKYQLSIGKDELQDFFLAGLSYDWFLRMWISEKE